MKAGDYIYSIEHELLGKGVFLRRAVILEWNEKTNHYKLGLSKNPMSYFTTGIMDLGLGLWAETPAEAVNLYITSTVRNSEKQISGMRETIANLMDVIKKTQKLDHTKLELKSYPDDWEPCDL